MKPINILKVKGYLPRIILLLKSCWWEVQEFLEYKQFFLNSNRNVLYMYKIHYFTENEIPIKKC